MFSLCGISVSLLMRNKNELFMSLFRTGFLCIWGTGAILSMFIDFIISDKGLSQKNMR